jgi:hypothetical protein
MAQQFEDGQWRLMTELDFDADKQPIPGSLKFRVDIHVPSIDEWEEFAAIKPWVLGVSPAVEAEEARMTALQHGIGIPDDLSELGDP